MKPIAIFKGRIADMRQKGQKIDYELAEHDTRSIHRKQCIEEGQASRLNAGFQPTGGDVFSVGEECPYAELGTRCDPICVYCDMKHVCMHCDLEPRSVEASIDLPCPMSIPGCRCSTVVGPSILQYYCNIGNPFMGADMQGVRDDNCFEEDTRDGDVIEEETRDDGLLEASRNESLSNVIGGEEPLDGEVEDEDEESIRVDTRDLLSPQSLWPVSPVFWEGPVPGDLPPPSQSRVDYYDYLDSVSEPFTIGTQSAVAADQYARGGRSQSSLEALQLSIPYDASSPFFLASPQPCDQSSSFASQHSPEKETPYSSTSVNYAIPSLGSPPFLHGSPGLNNREFKAAAENGIEGKAPFSRKRRREESRHGHKCAAVEEARSAQRPATKKDSRGWEDHEKVLVKVLLEEVLFEGTHARTEERWKVISKRLSSRYAIDRTWTAVKNYWNRHGRSDTGIDERKIKKPNRMITGVQDPESRRQARRLKHKDAELDYGDDLVNLVDDDDDEGAEEDDDDRDE